MRERIAVAGSGAIATGLAATVAAHHGDVLVLCRSEASAEKASKRAARLLERMEAGHGEVRVVTDPQDVAHVTLAIEAIVEEMEPKRELLGTLHEVLPPEAILATTTSSLPVTELARTCGRPTRFAGFHVFNPVPRMELIELVYPDGVDDDVREHLRALCRDLGKTCVEVPDTPGFIVNRLLFPYLFDAVKVMEQTGVDVADVDRCMTLGTGHPMGPLALLDFVGLDVSCAIADQIGVEVPQRVRQLVAEGALGRKVGRGFYEY